MHWKPERADVMAVTLAGNHPSSPLSASLWSRTGERRRSSETGKKVQGPRGTLRASSEHTPSLLYHNQSLSTNPGTVCDFGFTGYSQGGKHPNVFHYLKKKKKRNPHVFGSSGRKCFNLVPCPSSLDTPGQPPSSAVRQLQGLEAPRDTQKRVSSGQ